MVDVADETRRFRHARAGIRRLPRLLLARSCNQDYLEIAIITALVVILTAINLIGVKESARASDVFTVSKLIPLCVVCCRRLILYQPVTIHVSLQTPNFDSFSAAVFVLVYVFSGFEAVLVNSGEVTSTATRHTFCADRGLEFCGGVVSVDSSCLHRRAAKPGKLGTSTC